MTNIGKLLSVRNVSRERITCKKCQLNIFYCNTPNSLTHTYTQHPSVLCVCLYNPVSIGYGSAVWRFPCGDVYLEFLSENTGTETNKGGHENRI